MKIPQALTQAAMRTQALRQAQTAVMAAATAALRQAQAATALHPARIIATAVRSQALPIIHTTAQRKAAAVLMAVPRQAEKITTVIFTAQQAASPDGTLTATQNSRKKKHAHRSAPQKKQTRLQAQARARTSVSNWPNAHPSLLYSDW